MKTRIAPTGEIIRLLVDAQDVNGEIIAAAEQCHETYFIWQERVDWEEFIDKLETYVPADMEIPDYDNAAVRKIQRHIRQIRSQI